MLASFATIIAIIAGLINGFYVFPIKQGAEQRNLRVWIAFSLIAFITVPVIGLSVVFLTHSVIVPYSNLLIMILTGLIYGVGIFLVADSMSKIGIGIPFVLSLALVTIVGSLFSTVLDHKVMQNLNTSIVLSYVSFFIAIILYALATSFRDGKTSRKWGAGLILCMMGSILQTTQGACLSYYSNEIKLYHGGIMAQFLPWFLIYIPCGVIFIILNTYKLKKNKMDIKPKDLPSKSKLLTLAIMMTILNITSVVLYTYANTYSQLFSEKFLWAVFLGGIVLGSTCLSFLKGEWRAASTKAILVNFIAMGFLLISFAIMVAAPK